MKKIGTLVFLLAVVVGIYAAQDTDITNREVRDPHKLEAWLEANAADVETGRAIQSDTNTTTVATQYTPAYAGQVLAGAVGSTNDIWISKGTTTNDWVKVAP